MNRKKHLIYILVNLEGIMKIIDEIKKIELTNKHADIFYEYDGWCLDEIITDLAVSKEEVEEIKQELAETLSYCALRELNRFDFTSISEGYYKTIQDTCGAFDTRKKLDELYEELRIEDPYKEKEQKDTYNKYDYDWETERD